MREIYSYTFPYSSDESDDEMDDETEAGANNEDLMNACGIAFSLQGIPPALRRRNILRERPRPLSNPTIEVNAFQVFHTSEMT
jgi:hypothetical protein